jgi:hypothetical protein
MAYSIAWNEATPVGASTNVSDVDAELQNLKISIRERMNNVMSTAWETDASDPKTLDVQAIAGTPRLAKVYTNAAFALPSGANTVVDFVAETYDTDTIHDNAVNPSRLTVGKTGYYRVRAEIGITSGANAALANLDLLKNGVVIAQSYERHTGGTTVQGFSVETIDLATTITDYYEVRVTQASGDAWATLTTASTAYFELEHLPGAAP